jgi:preprotein translocase subunit SecY
MIEKLIAAWQIPDVKRRILFVLFMFAVFAVGAHIPVPGVNPKQISSFMAQTSTNNLFGLINAFSGGALRRFSVFAMGIAPYINASIIAQMMTMAIPKWRAIEQEGEAGRKRIAGYTRVGSIVLGVVQSIGMLLLFRQFSIVIAPIEEIVVVVTLTAGSTFLLWLGEQVTEHGVGNGVSLVIFAGIMLSMPTYISGIFATIQGGSVPWINAVFLVAAFVGMVVLVVYITQGTRRIPVMHFKRVVGRGQTQGGSSFLPIKVNSAGVIPIIFAISLMLLPATLMNAVPATIGSTLYVEDMADNLNKGGSYIPGIRMGKPTLDYLEAVVSRITFAGAIFLAFIAVMQYVVPTWTGFPTFTLIGGTSLLILVGVAIETMQAIEAQLLMRNYEGFIKKGPRSPQIGQ